jgi:serine/threonine-protein kinase RsbT
MAVVICSIGREVDVYVAIGRGREIATLIGFDDIDRTRIEIVILELTRNLLAHAGKGELHLDTLEETGRRGMLVMTSDGAFWPSSWSPAQIRRRWASWRAGGA